MIPWSTFSLYIFFSVKHFVSRWGYSFPDLVSVCILIALTLWIIFADTFILKDTVVLLSDLMVKHPVLDTWTTLVRSHWYLWPSLDVVSTTDDTADGEANSLATLLHWLTFQSCWKEIPGPDLQLCCVSTSVFAESRLHLLLTGIILEIIHHMQLLL